MVNASEALDTALEKKPDFADALVELARLAVSGQKPDEAARLTARAIASAPKHVDA